jgi:hypothetical protein
MKLKRNYALVPSVSSWKKGDHNHADDRMENVKEDSIEQNDAEKYREYAAECRRLAARVSEKDRKVLMEIADAWISCAVAAERKKPSNSGK